MPESGKEGDKFNKYYERMLHGHAGKVENKINHGIWIIVDKKCKTKIILRKGKWVWRNKENPWFILVNNF